MGAEVAVSLGCKNLHAAVARSTFASQNAKKLTGSDHFLQLGCRKIARSAFSSQNTKKMKGLDHFLKLGCRKIVRRCSEKHVCKPKC